MENISLYRLKQIFKNFDDFARFCYSHGTILIDLKKLHTRETYFSLGRFYCLVEIDNDKVEKIAYYTEKPAYWDTLIDNPYNVAKPLN